MKIIDTKRGERGTQIVELALVLPLMLFLALAVSEAAGMIRTHQVLNNAAREGARFAVLGQNSPANVNNGLTLTDCTGKIKPPQCLAVTNYAKNNGIANGTNAGQCNGNSASDGLNITIDMAVKIPNGSSNIMGTQVTVVCPYSLHFLPKVPSFGITGQVNLKGSAVFRNFY